MYYIYVIQNRLDLKVYIGQTVNPGRRWSDHKWLSKNNPIQYIHRAIEKYGIENFIFQIIDQTDDGYKISELEIDWINWFKSRNHKYGYNLASGGEEPWNRGLPSKQQPMYGKHHSEESKRKISENNIGKKNPHTKEWSNKVSKIKMGHFVSEETKMKISQKHLGKTLSEETKIKMSHSKKGIVPSESTRLKRSLSKRGDKSNSAKLSWDNVNIIRQKYNEEKISISSLANEYGVCYQTIRAIIKYETWKID